MTPAEPVPPFDAFLSYHSGDGPWVTALKAALEARGLRLWIDAEQMRPGDLFPGALARALGQVHCVVIILSPGALASAWVEEELNLALAHRCRIVAALIDDVEPPGFLAGRTWVDFRDDAEFAARLDQLVFGITGTRAPTAAHIVELPEYRDEAPAAGSTDEAEVLNRLIARRRHETRRLWIARGVSAVAGSVIGVAFFIVGSDASTLARLAVAALAPTILGLAVWGVTTTGLTRANSKVEQFEVLRDGLEACRARSHPGCRRLRQHFWEMMTRAAAEIRA